MKKYAVVLLLFGLCGCLANRVDDDLRKPGEETFVNVPDDFTWSPILQEMIRVELTSEGAKTKELDNTLIELYNSDDEFLDALTIIDGVAEFQLRIPSSTPGLKLVTPATGKELEFQPEQTKIEFNVADISAFHFEKTDLDGDGLYDQFDADPNNSDLTIKIENGSSLKSASGRKSSTSTYTIFEDLWPAKGDYDFNDLVVKTTYSWERGKGNYIEEIAGVCNVEWIGAGLELGLGLELFESTGTNLIYHRDIIRVVENAEEDGKVTNGFIVFSRVQDKGKGEIEFKIKLKEKQIKDFVCIPYLFRTNDPQHQVRPFGAPPTENQNMSMFRTYNDASPVSWNREKKEKFKYPLSGNEAFYRSPENHPWGIEFMAKTFKPTSEKTSILNEYPRFREWAESGGKKGKDWYNHPN